MLKLVKSVVFSFVLASILAISAPVWAASNANPTVKAASPSANSIQTAERVVKLLGNLLSRAQIPFHGELRLTQKHGFHAEAFFGSPGYIELGESYANQLTDGELTFVISHELAHLLSDHQARLVDAYDKKKSAGLSVAAQSDLTRLAVLQRDLELDADRIGAVWTIRAGFSAADAASALERAYGAAQQVLGTHPALKVRTSALLSAR
ncbi:MAG: M48 family metalloprotease [Burkholderiales bacterium]|nr:M48 family metalloprotease [Burkholderiales bacterium]